MKNVLLKNIVYCKNASVCISRIKIRAQTWPPKVDGVSVLEFFSIMYKPWQRISRVPHII